MLPHVPGLRWAVAWLAVAVFAQAVVFVRLSENSKDTRHAIRSLPYMYMIASAGSVVGVYLMFDLGLALKTSGVLLLGGLALALALRYGFEWPPED